MDPEKTVPTTNPNSDSLGSPPDSIDSVAAPSISSLPSLTEDSGSSLNSPIISTNTLSMEGGPNYLPRTMEELESLGYAPVWSRVHGYPGTIPEEILEYLDESSPSKQTCNSDAVLTETENLETNLASETDEWIGPLSSLFWLAGLDELVDAVSDPAIRLQDEVRMIPTNVGITWILEDLFIEEKLPKSLYNRYFYDFDPYEGAGSTVMPVRLDAIPFKVGSLCARHRLCDLFPVSRLQSLPQEITTVRIKGDKHKLRSAKKIEEYLPKSRGTQFLFRVCTRSALASLMAFFTPVVNGSNFDNELGPGIYTSDSLEWVLKFGFRNRALLVFKNPDFRALNVWTASLTDWQHIVATWTQKPLSNTPNSIPTEWRSADIIHGPISKPSSTRIALPEPGEYSQTVAVSPAGCAALASSLDLIVWIE
ncbi:unnamed protein product [Penicillium olsonii]|nr:unnamed protein product [Penicillium olsonii]